MRVGSLHANSCKFIHWEAFRLEGTCAIFPYMTYLITHWRGEHSLARSFWLNVVAVNLLLYLLFMVIEPQTPFLWPIVLHLIVMTTLLSFASIWQVVGVWRSAERHVEEGGKEMVGLAAKCMIAIAAALSVAEVGTKGVITVEAIQMVAGVDRFSGAKVKIRPPHTIQYVGGIGFDGADTVEELSAKYPGARVLEISSIGGRHGAGQRIKNLVQKRQMTVAVKGKCLSACTTIFMAGAKRVVAPKARVGFHRSYLPGLSTADMDEADSQVWQYLKQRGVPNWFIKRIEATPHDKMWYPTIGELHRAQVITHVLVKGRPIPAARYCQDGRCR